MPDANDSILQTPLTEEDWHTVRRDVYPFYTQKMTRSEADKEAFRRLMIHTIIREKILAEVAIRLDNLHGLAAKRTHLADGAFRDTATDALAFIAQALESQVLHRIVAENLAAIG